MKRPLSTIKLIPGVGAVVGGSLDLVETKAIGTLAYKWFFEGDFSNGQEPQDDTITIVAEDIV